MPFVGEDFIDLVRLLEQRPEWRAELRRLLLTDEVLALPQAVEKLTEQVQALAAQVAALTHGLEVVAGRLDGVEQSVQVVAGRLDGVEQSVQGMAGRLDGVEQRLDGVEQRLDGVEQGLDGVGQRLDGVERRLGRVEQDVGYLKGSDLEGRYRERAPSYFRSLALGIVALSTAELSTLLDKAVEAGQLSAAEADEVLRADLVIRGRRREDRAKVYLVVEVSWGVGPGDVERAVRRAALLAQLGVPAIPVVAGQAITDEAAALAERLEAWRVIDGRPSAPTEPT